MADRIVGGPLKIMAHEIVTSAGCYSMHIAVIDESGKITLRPFEGEESGVEFVNGRVVLSEFTDHYGRVDIRLSFESM